MLRNREARARKRCREQFDYWGGKMQEPDFEETQRRLQRVRQMAWCNLNCHYFAETFRQRIWEPLKNPRLDEVCR